MLLFLVYFTVRNYFAIKSLSGCSIWDIYEDEKSFDKFRMQNTLNSLNASTSYYELKIVGKCLPEKLDKVLEGVFSMILSPKLNEEDFNNEKKTIVQESWQKFYNDKYINYIKKYISILYHFFIWYSSCFQCFWIQFP